MKTILRPHDLMKRFAGHDLTKTNSTVWRRMPVVMLLASLFANVAFPQSLGPPAITTCGQVIADHVAWLKASPNNQVDAYVASNEAVIGSSANIVTFAGLSLKTLFNTLVTNPILKNQFFSNRTWSDSDPCNPVDPNDFCLPPEKYYPFSPYATEKIAMTAHANGSIHISSNSGKTNHTFTPSSCGFGVITGRVGRTGYLITLKKSVVYIPEKPQ
jgi:hypothetical protein